MNKIFKKLLSLLVLSFTLTFFLVSETVSEYNIDDYEYEISDYYNEYQALLNSGKNTIQDAGNFLDKWEEEYNEAEVYKMATYLFHYLASSDETIKDIQIEENEPFTTIPDPNDEKNVLFVYRDKVLSFSPFYLGLTYLTEGLTKYTNRFDLWDALISSYEVNALYEDEALVLCDLLDFVDYMNEIGGNWYLDFNEPFEDKIDLDFDEFLYNYYISCCNTMMDVYPDEQSARMVYERLLDYFGDDSFLYGELGYTYLFESPEDAIYYSEIAYELDNENYVAVHNILVAAFILEDEDLIDEYESIIYESNDDSLIESYEITKNAFLE